MSRQKQKKNRIVDIAERTVIVIILGTMNGTILASIKLLGEAGFVFPQFANTLMLYAPVLVMMYSLFILDKFQDGVALIFVSSAMYVIITLLALSIPAFMGLVNDPTLYISANLNHLISTQLIIFPLLVIGFVLGFMVKGFSEVLKTVF